MSLKRWAARRDSNERGIIDALREVGASVAQISETGAPDLVVYFRGVVTLLEVKRPKGKGQARGRATMAQQQRSQEGWPVVTVEDATQALAAVGIFYSTPYQPVTKTTTTTKLRRALE